MSTTGELAGAGLLLGVLGAGTASGLLPVVSAEGVLTAATAGSPHLWLGLAVSLTLGQCSAKVLIYLTAREGPQHVRSDGRLGRLVEAMRAGARARADARPRHRSRRAVPGALTRLRPERLRTLLGRPCAGTSIVLVSAGVGLPPLAAVSVMAGAARLRLPLFVADCLTGRLARFVLIAWPVAHLLTR
jgi:membrane protein YqaA with SNARE-associated domain